MSGLCLGAPGRGYGCREKRRIIRRLRILGHAIKETVNIPGLTPGKGEQLSNLKPSVVGGQVPQSQATSQKSLGGKNVPAIPD